jgi:hypothetical protein
MGISRAPRGRATAWRAAVACTGAALSITMGLNFQTYIVPAPPIIAYSWSRKVVTRYSWSKSELISLNRCTLPGTRKFREILHLRTLRQAAQLELDVTVYI